MASGWRHGRRACAGLAMACFVSCGVLPDEFNLSPIYRHRVAPDGRLEELDILWPIVHWERSEHTGGGDTRVRPLWRQLRMPAENRVEHQYLAPLGDAYADSEETKVSLFPFFYYRKHLEEGQPGNWDIDWNLLYLLYGGHSADGEDYLGLLPIYGKLKDFLTYDELGWFLFPLHLWWKKGTAHSTQFLWPLISWGEDGREGGQHWFRILPFYGENIEPGVRANYSVLWPFFHWGHEQRASGRTNDFFFWPVVGWSLGPKYRIWTLLWPFFRYGSEITQEGEEPEYWQLDAPFPFVRLRKDDSAGQELRQQWFFPLFGHTTTTTKDVLSVLYPFGWFQKWEDATTRHLQTAIIPFFSDSESRRKKPGRLLAIEDVENHGEETAVEFEEGRKRRLRLWPIFGLREEPDGSWAWQCLDVWPFAGKYAYGINEAYDWAWVLAEGRGDSRGNTSLRSFANVFTSRNFAGRRFQCSVPFLFNYEETESGDRTLRLFQVLPIRF